MVVGLLAEGKTIEEILTAHPYLDVRIGGRRITYAAWRAEEEELPLATGQLSM